jgi:hypothetical protein
MVGYDHGQCEYTAFTYDPTKLADFAKWRTACKDKKWADPPIVPSELKWLVRDNIFTEDEGTEKAIDAAIAKVTADGKGDPAAMHTFRRTSTGDELAAYQLIAGTSHGDRVNKMLADYHGEMKDLKIDAFHVFNPQTTRGNEYHMIVMEFGR